MMRVEVLERLVETYEVEDYERDCDPPDCTSERDG